MDEKERVNESPETAEQVPAAQTENPGKQNSRPGRNVRGGQTQILNIQKKKKEKTKAAGQKEKKENRLRHEVVEKQDIRYRGPLSYRHLMILGWLCVILQQVSIILTIAGQADPSIAEATTGLVSFGSFAGMLFMPLLLLANFSQILSSKQQFKSLLLKYGGLSVAMGLALVVVYEHFVKGIANTIERLAPDLGGAFLVFFQQQVFSNGYLAYNMFIDLFLCTLFMFFLMYHFKRPVKRGWVICFRLLAILPVAYELACIVLKTLSKTGALTLPMYASPFLTTKPPMAFAAFIALALFIKRREIVFLKNGRSYEEYGHFLETNANSLYFSVHACVTFIVAALLDMAILLIFTTALAAGDVLAYGEEFNQVLENREMLTGIVTNTVNVATAAGFGESLVLLFIAPFVLLFSYTRKHKNTNLDAFIPMIAIVVIAAIYVEAFFQAVCQIPDVLQMYLESIPELDLSKMGLSEEEILEITQLLTQLAP